MTKFQSHSGKEEREETAVSPTSAHHSQQTAQKIAQLETLYQTGLAVASQTEKPKLLQLVVAQAVDLLDATSGGIYEYNATNKTLTLLTDSEQSEQFDDVVLNLGEGAAGQLVAEGEPYLIVPDYEQYAKRAEVYTGKRYFGSVIEVPLRKDGEIIGVLYVDDDVSRQFDKDDALLLQRFAKQAASALFTANVINQDSEKVDYLQQLTHASSNIMSKLGRVSLDEILTLIARHAASILNAEACSICLVQGGMDKKSLRFEASYGYVKGGIKKGRKFSIRTGKKTGLSGHIAHTGKLFNAHGEKLVNHQAVKGKERPYMASGQCYSMLAIPLHKQNDAGACELVGLLRVDNKKDDNGRIAPTQQFNQQDEWILTLFAETAVAAIKSAELLNELNEQKDHFHRILSSSPNCVIAIDKAGYIFFFNEQIQALLGFKEKDVIGRIVHDIYAEPFEAQKIYRLLKENNGHLREYETAVITKSGERVPIRLTATWLYDANSDMFGSVGYFEDLRSVREKRRRLEWLLAANHAVSQTQELAQGLQKLSETMIHLVGSNYCTIMTIDENHDYLYTKAVAPVSPLTGIDKHALQEADIALQDWPDLIAFLYDKGPTILRKREGWQGELLRRLPTILGFRHKMNSLLAIPLRVNSNVVGLLCLGNVQADDANPFIGEMMKPAIAIAEQTAVLIERMLSHEATQRQQQLLKALDETSRHIRGEKEIDRLWQEIVRLGADLVGCTAGGLFINRPHIRELELTAVYQLSPDLLGSKLSHGEGLLGKVAQNGDTRFTNEYTKWVEPEKLLTPFAFQTVVGIPLFQDGKIAAVLFVADTVRRHRVTRTELDILERFGVHACIALKTAQLMDSEQRMYAQLALLQQMGDYIQATDDLDKILHAILTGVTAVYGLCFNRALIMLHDPSSNQLVGRMGIGHYEASSAYKDWSQEQQLTNFNTYLTQLEKGVLKQTPMEKRVRSMVIEVGLGLKTAVSNPIAQVIQNKRPQLVKPELFSQLPAHFSDIFQPATPFIIAPLIVRDKAIGLLVADNLFTHSPITAESIDHLLTFTNSAAIAIDKTHLYTQTTRDKEQLHAFYEGSSKLISSRASSDVLQDIVNRTQKTIDATWVSLLLFDDFDNFQNGITSVDSHRENIEPAFTVRQNGLSVKVLQTGNEIIIEDVAKEAGRVNESLFKNKVAAAACLPLEIRNERIGVMWIHYDQPRRFMPFEREALRLFVNQAAIAYDNAHRLEALDQMRRAADALTRTSTLKKVLAQINRGAKEVLSADYVVLWAYDQGRKTFELQELDNEGVDPELWGKIRTDSQRPNGTSYQVLKKGWLGVSDMTDWNQHPFLSKKTCSLLAEEGMCSFQAVALTVGDEQLGVLYLDYRQPRLFKESDRETAQTFATHVAISLKQAKLLDGLRVARNTAHIVARVTTLEDLDSTLHSVINGTQDALNCDAISLYSYSEKTEKLLNQPYTLGLWFEEGARQLAHIPKQSIILNILQRRRLYIADHVPTDPLFEGSRFSREEGVASCVGIPLRVGSACMGVMFVNYRTSHRFTGDDLENIELYANQAAVAIYNAQLYEQEQRQTRVQKALNQASRAVTASLDLKKILRQLADQTRFLVGHQEKPISYASIWRVINDKQVRLEATYPQEAFDTTKARLGQDFHWQDKWNGRIGMMGRAILTKTSVVARDVADHPDYIETQNGTLSALVVPILKGDHVIGVLNVEHSGFYDAFDEDSIDALESLAAHAALAIENADWYETAVKQAKLLDAAAQVATHAITNVNENKLLNDTVQLISAQLGFYHTAIFLLNEKGEFAEIRASSSPDGQEMVKTRYCLKVGEDGIVGQVAKNGAYRLASDVELDPHHLVNPHLPYTISEMAFPLIVYGKIIGVLDVQSQEMLNLSDAEVATLQTIAHQLANAIQNARIYTNLQKRETLLNALYEAGQAIADSLDGEAVLAAIVEQAWKLIGIYGLNPQSSCVMLVKDTHLEYAAAFPLEILPQLKQQLVNLDLTEPVKYGIIGRAVKTGEPQLVDDVLQDKNYVIFHSDTRSELAVPIWIGNKVIGVINVEHPQKNAFDEDDKQALIALAAHASTAIGKAHSYQTLEETLETLRRTNQMVRARTAVAWMGMASSIWRHDIGNYAVTIRDQITLLQNDINSLPPNQAQTIENRLRMITRLAGKIQDKPITSPLSSEESIERIPVNALVGERANQLWQNDPYRSAKLQLDLQLTDDATIRISPEWIRRAFDILLQNGVTAMNHSSVKHITVRTQMVAELVEISVIDTGPGLPQTVRDKIGIESIEKPEDATGFGMGLLMAQMIVQAFGGEIKVGETGEDGTTMLICLPLEKKGEEANYE